MPFQLPKLQVKGQNKFLSIDMRNLKAIPVAFPTPKL